MWEQIETLKYHTNFRTDRFNILQIACQIGAMHINDTLLMFFQTVDTANER